jgi:transposase-like protein
MGNTIEFMLSAKRFFKKMIKADHRRLPFTISVDKNAAYPEAFTASQKEKVLPKDCKLRSISITSSSRITASLRKECERALVIAHLIQQSEHCK